MRLESSDKIFDLIWTPDIWINKRVQGKFWSFHIEGQIPAVPGVGYVWFVVRSNTYDFVFWNMKYKVLVSLVDLEKNATWVVWHKIWFPPRIEFFFELLWFSVLRLILKCRFIRLCVGYAYDCLCVWKPICCPFGKWYIRGIDLICRW